MAAHLLHFLLLLLAHRSSASSSAADIWVCSADAPNLGCRSGWGTTTKRVCPETIAGGDSPFLSCYDKTVVNRGNCLDENTAGTISIMPWTAAPVLSADGFELRARRDHLAGVAATGSPGATDPLAAYTGGDWITISLHVLQYDKKYRGLLLHADDAAGKKVGEWGLPEMSSAPFWHPPVCGPKTVLHSGAAVKSLTSRFRFKAPPAGTGSITFKALTKVGAANTGEFYRPLDLVLPEAIASGGSGTDGGAWIVGLAGVSCDETCRQHGANGSTTTNEGRRYTCDETVMFAGLKTPAETAAALSPVYPCNGPLIIDCGDPSVPATTTVPARRRCWYQDGICGAVSNVDDSTRAPAAVTGRELCAANTSVSMRRFCACNASSSSRTQRVLQTQHKTAAVSRPPPPPAAAAQQLDYHHDEREAAARRLQKAATSVWEKGTGDVLHGTTSHENWRPSGEFWYNPMTGATSKRAPMDAAATVNYDDDDLNADDLNDLNDDVDLLAFSAGARSHGRPKMPLLPLLLLSLLPTTMIDHHRRGGTSCVVRLCFTMVLLTVVAPSSFFVRAHNWIQTPRRGLSPSTITPSIATELPCGSRRPSDIHYQVGPGQQFAVKFSAGHSSRYSFLVMPGSETDWLQRPDIMEMAEDYIANAPDGTNKANVKGFRRIRDAAPDGTFHVGTNKANPDYLPKRIFAARPSKSEHPEWIEHPDYPNRETWVFADKYIAAQTEKNSDQPDYSVAYESAKYPWLEAVQSYFISFHNAADYDVIPISIPGFHGVGHYVVWYKWRGYSGCIDVEMFDRPVPFPYGKPANVNHPDYVSQSKFPFVYQSTDHCHFDTYKSVASTCVPTGNASQNAVTECVDLVNDNFANGLTDSWAYGNGANGIDFGTAQTILTPDEDQRYRFLSSARFDLRKFAIQAVPMANHDLALPGVAPHIPWDSPTCAVHSPVLKIDPVRIRRSDALLSAEHMRNHPALFGRIDYRENQMCTATSGAARMPLRKALSACATNPECAGISVDLQNRAVTTGAYREFVRDDGSGGACRDGHQDWNRGQGPGKVWSKPRLTDTSDPLYDADVVAECGNRCRDFLGVASMLSWIVSSDGGCMCRNLGTCDNIRNSAARSYHFTYGSKPSPILTEFNASALHDVQFCTSTATKQKQGVVLLKNATASQQDLVPITPASISSEAKPSFPGPRNNRGLGYEQGLAVGKTIKISFQPDRQPSCQELQTQRQYLDGPIDCYWCFRNASDCGNYFSCGWQGKKCGDCEKCKSWRASGFKTFEYFPGYNLPYEMLPAFKRKPEIDFDIRQTGEILPNDWAIDSGLLFGARAQRAQYTGTVAGSSDSGGSGGLLEYGWSCDVQDDAWFTRDQYVCVCVCVRFPCVCFKYVCCASRVCVVSVFVVCMCVCVCVCFSTVYSCNIRREFFSSSPLTRYVRNLFQVPNPRQHHERIVHPPLGLGMSFGSRDGKDVDTEAA